MEKENSTLNLSALTDLLGKALSSPEIMSAVASLLAMLREPQSPPQAAQSELLTEQAEPVNVVDLSFAQEDEMFTSRDLGTTYENEILIECNGTSAESASDGVSIDGSQITITADGT